MSVITSPEFFINMKSTPVYDKSKHFWEQDDDVLQFYKEEKRKFTEGITINGIFISPWLYFHCNFFKAPIFNPAIGRDDIQIPSLRDNEWYFAENYQDAKEQNKHLFIFGSRRYGKALRNDQELLHEDETWKPIVDCKIGDKIYGSDGKLTTVLGIYPQGKVDMYEVSFQDGRKSYCCDEHLWTVWDYQAGEYKVLPLKTFMNRYKFYRTHKRGGTSEVFNYYIPITKPVEFSEKKLSIDPYILGSWLGDGHTDGTRITNIDKTILKRWRDFAKKRNLIMKVVGSSKITYNLSSEKKGRGCNSFLNDLKSLNVIGNKHIPEEYFNSSVSQRMELLRGIMDTDGTIGRTGGGICVTLSHEVLSKDILRLCRSLGIFCHYGYAKGSYIKKNGEFNDEHRVTMFTKEPVFTLKRKLDRIDKNPVSSRLNKMGRVAITGIKKVEPDYATCIRVDNESKEFLTNEFVVTHNTSVEASLIQWTALCNPYGQSFVLGGSTEDLDMLTKGIRTGMNEINPAFYMENNRNDWSKHIQLGLKTKSNRALPYHDIYIRNLEEGKEKKSEKTAGGTPIGFVVDEAGKFKIKSIWEAALPSFNASNQSRTVGVLTGTGGNQTLSQDAIQMLRDPDAYRLLPMNWDRLENRIEEKDLITWKRSTFGIFVPGQMGLEIGNQKKETNLKEYLKIKEPAKDLEKIKFQATDWRVANEVIGLNRKLKLKDKGAYDKYCMYHPFDPEDCAIVSHNNPFPTKEAQKHRQYLVDQGLTGKLVDLTLSGGRVAYEFSDKRPIEFPFKGGVHDAPVMLFTEFPEQIPPYGLNVSGLDPYKQTKAGTDSVGAFYILRREGILDDPFAGCILASYSSRPAIPDNFDRTCEWLIESFNAECLMENADIGFIRYLERKGKADMLLANGVDFSKRINPKASANTPYGLYPTPKNQSHLIKGLLNYCNEELITGFEEDMTPIKTLGITRINDIYLLDEIISYKPGGNFDRMIAFAHALAWADYMDTIGIKVESGEQQEKKEEIKKKRTKNYFTDTSKFNRWRN